MEKAIVLKNIRRDIPAMKPLAAKVIQLQRQLIEAVQRYQELNSKPDRDEALLKELMDDIARINQSQREELALVREAEDQYSSSSPQPEEVNGVVDDEASSSQPITDSEDSVSTPLIEEEEEMPEEEPEESAMDWEDLTRENWSENDKLLQKIERLGSRVPQLDFMSSVELVHVTKYKEVEEAMAKRKLRMIDGKPVVTTGPWQMIDIPTKVSNRRCNYLTGLHVTVRPKDLMAIKKPLSSGPAIYEGGVGGIKTRNSNGDSRGSSRNSSRASSPVSSLSDHRLQRNGHQPSNLKLSRSIKTRASKLKRAAAPVSANNYTKIAAPAPVKTSTPVPAVTTPKTPITPASSATTTTTPSTAEVKPFVTYTVVDGIPHFRVIFPPKNSSSNGSVNQGKTTTPTSIVESAVRSGSASSSSSTASSSSGRENGLQPSRTSVKPILKRPRLSQGLSPTKTASNGSSPSAPLETLASPSSSSNNKEEIGRCLEKCGSWMGAPHFKIYRTFPPVNGTGSAGPLTSPPAPKLSSPKTTLPASIKSSVMPPKLIMGGNNHHNNNTGNKYVSIAPKTTIIAPMNGVKPRPPASVLKTCPPLFGAKHLMKECQQNNLNKMGLKQQQSMGASAGGEEDLKKKTTVTKVVKLLPSGNEQFQSGAEEASHFSPPPTVIVADMSV